MQYNIYDIDFKRLVRQFIPRLLHSGEMLAFLYALVAPVSFIHQALLRYRKAKSNQLMITPQVCYLERLLNDRFDFTERRIYIDDALWFGAWYIFQEEELKPEYLYTEPENNPVYLFTDNESGDIKDDFIVFVPSTLNFDENELRSLLDGYRLAGKRYKVQKI